MSSTNPSAIELRNREALDLQWGRRFPRVDSAAVRQPPGRPDAVEIAAADGRWVPVADRDDCDVAARWLDGALAGRALPDAVCVIGAARGHVLDVIAARSPSTRMLVLEPEPGLIGPLLARRDWRPLITAGRLLVLAGPEYDGAALAWKLLDGEATPLTLIHPVIGRERREAAKAAARVVGRAMVDWTSNREARRVLGTQYLRNTLANVPLFDRAGDVDDIANLTPGVPAIVAGAGPSLNQNLAELTALGDLHERAVVIATDTAIRPCVAAGIRPDFAVAVDASDANARHLVDPPPGLDTWLVAEASVAPAALRDFSDHLLLWRVGDHEPWPLLHDLGMTRGTLRVWGSVLTSAADLALKLGCDPIIFIGADLAYSGGRPYCAGTVYDADWAEARRNGLDLDELWRSRWMKEPAVYEAGIEGASTRTAAHFASFRDWLVDLSTQHRDRRFVNATGAGILRGGAFAQMAPADALREALTRRVNRRPWAIARPPRTPASDHIVERLLCAGRDASQATSTTLASARIDALPIPAMMAAHDLAELTRLEAAPLSGEARRTLGDVSLLIERVGSDRDAVPALTAHLTSQQPWREWPLLDRVRTVNRICHACVTFDVPAAPVYDAMVPVFQESLGPELHPGLAASMYDQLHGLCWHNRHGGTGVTRFRDDIVEPMRRHSRAWADARALPARGFSGRERPHIAYLGYNSRLEAGHPAALAVLALLQGHTDVASGAVDVSYLAWRVCDAQWRRALDELGVPIHECDWPSHPCGALAALRGLLEHLQVDAIVTDQSLGVPTVLFEARSAPLQILLDTGFAAWSPHLTDEVVAFRQGDDEREPGRMSASTPMDLATRIETMVLLARASR